MIDHKFEINTTINWTAVLNEIQTMVEDDDMDNHEIVQYLNDNEDEYVNIILV